jgi:hypothetical protein
VLTWVISSKQGTSSTLPGFPTAVLACLCDQVIQQAGGQLILVAIFVQAPNLQLMLQLSLQETASSMTWAQCNQQS